MDQGTSFQATEFGADDFTRRLTAAWDDLARKAPERRITQLDLANYCGITQGSVSNWFTGATKRVQGPTLLRLAEYLGVSPTWLVTGEGSREQGAAPAVGLWNDSLEQALRVLCTALAAQTPARRESIGLLMQRLVQDPRPEWTYSMSVLFDKPN